MQPDESIELSTRSANSLICILHGVTFDQVDAIPTNDFEKSDVSKPTPLSIDLDAACKGPSTNFFEYFLLDIIKLLNNVKQHLKVYQYKLLEDWRKLL